MARPRERVITVLANLKKCARSLRTETYALYLVARDPRTPWYAKLLAAAVVGYAFSPIDLIPDFIPVLGYLDDLILVPAGIWLALRLVPAEIMEESRTRAAKTMEIGRPVGRTAAVVIVLIWLALAGLLVAWAYRIVHAAPRSL